MIRVSAFCFSAFFLMPLLLAFEAEPSSSFNSNDAFTEATAPGSAAAKGVKNPRLPNIILLLTDDQDAITGGMDRMPKLERLLKQRGMSFENAFVHTPICCPSRMSILSGQYLHSMGAVNNSVEGNCNGVRWQEENEPYTFAAILKQLGYQTSFAGKYLNAYASKRSLNCSFEEKVKTSAPSSLPSSAPSSELGPSSAPISGPSSTPSGGPMGMKKWRILKKKKNMLQMKMMKQMMKKPTPTTKPKMQQMMKKKRRTKGCLRIPPGWDRWLGLAGNSKYYNYSVIRSNDDFSGFGKDIAYGDKYNEDYFPDLVVNYTLESIKLFTSKIDTAAGADNNDTEQKPFLLVVSWPTAHGPFTPAPWAESYYQNATILKTPNFNASAESVLSKRWMMRWLPPISSLYEERMNKIFRQRIQGLMSVDNHIEQLEQALKDGDLSDNTWIVYTSDNGWHFGQHRLGVSKRHLYETDIRVPFIVKGPHVPPNTASNKIVLNVDIAPSFLDIALQQFILTSNETKDEEDQRIISFLQNAINKMDGTSFLPAIYNHTDFLANAAAEAILNERKLMQSPSTTNFRKDFLISYHGEGSPKCDNHQSCPAPVYGDPNYHGSDFSNNTYHCVRTIVTADQAREERENSYDTKGTINGIPIERHGPEDSVYCRFIDNENFIEFYDMIQDPWQLNNSINSLDLSQRIYYEGRLAALRHCQAGSCRMDKVEITCDACSTSQNVITSCVACIENPSSSCMTCTENPSSLSSSLPSFIPVDHSKTIS